MGKNMTNRVISNFFWRFAERTGAQLVSFVVSIVLARLLAPSDYGMIAIVTVFTSILQVFIDSGLGTALIQKKEADDLDFSSVFFFNIFFCTLLYIALFLSAPYIAKFYDHDQLTAVIRVMGLTIIISGLKNVQQAYVSKNMMFRRFFFATLGGTIVSTIIGIAMAYCGFGVWALVVQGLSNGFLGMMILWFTVRWRPKKQFSFSRLRVLFSFGWKMLASSLLGTVYNDIRQLIIGKIYSSEDLAYYNRGKQFPNLIVTNVNSSIDSVLLPVMSEAQGNPEKVKSMVRRSIKTSVYIMSPLMFGLAAAGDAVVSILLTDKWLPCIPFLRIFCISFLFQPIHTANLNAIKAMGRSDLFLKLEIIKTALGLAFLALSVRFGVLAIAISLLISNMLSQLINSWPNKTLLDYSYVEQLKDIFPSLLLGLVMAIVVFFIQLFGLNSWATLLLQVLLGAGIYIGGSIITKNDSYIYILDTIKVKFFKK